MPKQTLPLTDSQCKKLQPPNQLSDGERLYLQARGNGKYWCFRYYRPNDNKRDEMRLGVYPEISLKEAREKREELRGLIAKGIEPKLHQQDKAQRQAEQLKNTF
jgi:site-specific recombinase, phage integrase family